MSNELEKKQTGALAKTTRRGGEERAEQEDVEIPRAKLLQAMSDELKDLQTTLRQGQVINSITHEVLPETFIPIMRLQSVYVRFNPRKKDDPNFDKDFSEGAVLYRTNDSNDPRVKRDGKFGPKGEAPLVTKFLNFLCLFEGVDVPLVLSFSKSSFKSGKHFNLLIESFGGDFFSRKYRLTVKAESKPGAGNYFLLKVDPAGKVTEDEFALAESWYERLAPKRDTINVETEQEDLPEEAGAHDVKDTEGRKLF